MDKASFFTNATALQKVETTSVPGMGSFCIRGLSGAEYDSFESSSTIKGEDGQTRFVADRASLIRFGVVDGATGEPVFTDGDLPRLRKLPAAVLIPLAKAILKLSGVGDDAGKN